MPSGAGKPGTRVSKGQSSASASTTWAASYADTVGFLTIDEMRLVDEALALVLDL